VYHTAVVLDKGVRYRHSSAPDRRRAYLGDSARYINHASNFRFGNGDNIAEILIAGGKMPKQIFNIFNAKPFEPGEILGPYMGQFFYGSR
jgi:hypothetical protein